MIDLGVHPKVARLALVIGQPINRDVLADLQVRVIGDSPLFEVSQVDVFLFRRRDLGNFTFFEADKRHRSRSWPVYCGTCKNSVDECLVRVSPAPGIAKEQSDFAQQRRKLDSQASAQGERILNSMTPHCEPMLITIASRTDIV